jgi:acetyltransferase-like isoleucine patch superfamily enzyme
MELAVTSTWDIKNFEKLHKSLFKKLELSLSAKIYRGTVFRPEMKLTMSEKTFIGTGCIILVPELVMGEGSQINAGSILTDRQKVVLGKNIVIGYGVTPITASDTPVNE